MARTSARESILDAAERVVERQGLSSATIEAVAAEAGVSKGGLFYHFASKQELLSELLARYEERYRQFRDQLISEMPDTPNRLLKASLLASINHPARDYDKLSSIVAFLDDVALREKIVAMKQALFAEITKTAKRPERIALAMMAADGLVMSDLFGPDIFNKEFKQKVIDELLNVIDRLEDD